jgi:hypothetical protein
MIYANKNQHSLPIKILLGILAVALGTLFIGYEYLMLQWPMMREAHYLHYIGYLLNEHHFAPYRDVLETSWFGTFLFHMLVGKVFGYTSLAFRIADIFVLTALLVITWNILRRLDIFAAWIGTLTFALAYLHYGPANTLQRDFLILLPISSAVLISLPVQLSARLRAGLIGALFACAASIKPHAVMGLAPVLFLLYTQTQAPHPPLMRMLLQCATGFIATFCCGLLWLWYRDGLAAFIDMSLHYLPLYQDLNGAHEMITPAQRLKNTLQWWEIFTWNWPGILAISALRGWLVTEKNSQQRNLLIAILALALCYNLYPLPAGKFWDYHWVPFTYFAILSASLLLMPARKSSLTAQALTIACTLYFLHSLHSQYIPWRGLTDQLQRYPDISIDTRSEKEIADFLQQHLQPGDTLQVIDQGGPSTLYLLRAQAVLATPYLGSFVFLHHINEPYVQQAQKKFLQQLQLKKPKLMMVMTDFTRPSGQDTLAEIPGLKKFLAEHYQPLWQQPAFTIWQYQPVGISPPVSLAAPPPMLDFAPASPQ